MLQIRCKNNNITKSFPEGTSLLEVYQEFADELKMPYCASYSTKPHRTSSRVASCLLNTPYHADTTATSRRRVTYLSPTTT